MMNRRRNDYGGEHPAKGDVARPYAVLCANLIEYHSLDGLDAANAIESQAARIAELETALSGCFDGYADGFADGLEAAAKAVDGERLTDGTGEATDLSYNAAIRHCAAAIRALAERDSKPPR